MDFIDPFFSLHVKREGGLSGGLLSTGFCTIYKEGESHREAAEQSAVFRLPAPLAIASDDLQMAPLVQGRVTTTTQQDLEFTGQQCENDNNNHDLKQNIYLYKRKK